MLMSSTRHINNIYAATDSTNTRVIWWNIFEAVALVGMSVFQIYYLRR